MESKTLDQLADKYYEHVAKPARAKQPPQFSLAIIGVVGAGKSTVLGKICELLPMVRVSGDELREYIHAEGLAEPPGEIIAATNQKVVQRLRAQGYRVAYDNDFANPAIRSDMLEDNRKAGVPVLWIRVLTPEAFILNKLRSHEPSYLFKNADEAVACYYTRKALHESEADALNAIPFVYTFDASAVNLDEQIVSGVQKIQNRLREMTPRNVAEVT